MQRLPLAMRWGEIEGEPIWCPYPQVRAMRAFFRKGQLSMVAGPPGGGKTAFVTDYMLNQREQVLYFSADGDRGTVGNRIIAGLKGWPLHEVEEIMKNPPDELYDQLDNLTGQMRFCFKSTLNPDFITGEVQRYGMVYGEWPAIIVVDNLIDVTTDSGSGMDDHAGHAQSAKWLKELASETGSAVIVLHHTVGSVGGTDPIPRTSILGKIDRHPRTILTLHRPDEYKMGISVVKNSNGPADSDGFMFAELDIDLESMTFKKDKV